MKIFLDTSSLFKLYHRETDTNIIENIFVQNDITAIYLSEIAKIEFASTIWKRVRMQEIPEETGKAIIELFHADCGKYTFVQIDPIITQQAINLLSTYGKLGLRTLDSIQFSTALLLAGHVSLFVTADKLLLSFFKQASLPV